MMEKRRRLTAASASWAETTKVWPLSLTLLVPVMPMVLPDGVAVHSRSATLLWVDWRSTRSVAGLSQVPEGASLFIENPPMARSVVLVAIVGAVQVVAVPSVWAVPPARTRVVWCAPQTEIAPAVMPLATDMEITTLDEPPLSGFGSS